MLYNVYDIGTIQNRLQKYREGNKTKLRDDLAKKVYNQSHPFFN